MAGSSMTAALGGSLLLLAGGAQSLDTILAR